MKISQIGPMLASCFMSGDSPLISGDAGIGKTDSVWQYAHSINGHVEDLRLGNQEIGDLLGLPVVESRNGVHVTNWTAPLWLNNLRQAAWPEFSLISDLVFNDAEFGNFVEAHHKESKITKTDLTEMYNSFYNIAIERRDENVLIHGQTNVANKKSKHCVLFLDEISRAQTDVKAAALQIVLDKAIHQHKLPMVNGRKTFVVAAMNPDDGNYETQELDPALNDRFLTIEAEADLQSWLAWAKSANVNVMIRDYLAENPEHLYNKPKEGRWATPRGWAMLAKHVDNFDKVAPELHFSIIQGKVGKGIAVRVEDFIRNYSKNITIEDIAKVASTSYAKYKDIIAAAKDVRSFLEEKQIETTIITEKCYQMIDKMLPESKEKIDAKKSAPIYAFLHALDLEVLAGILHAYKAKDSEDGKYTILADGDQVYHASGKKELFLKLISAKK